MDEKPDTHGKAGFSLICRPVAAQPKADSCFRDTDPQIIIMAA